MHSKKPFGVTKEKAELKSLDAKKSILLKIAFKLLQWTIFSIVIALFPIVINGFKEVVTDSSFDYASLVSHGELMLVYTAITGEAIGDIYVSKKIKGC